MTLALADTSVWTRSLRAEVSGVLADAVEDDQMAIIAPIVLELLRGTSDIRALERDARLYDTLPSVKLTPAIAERARDVQRRLAWRGYHRGPSAVDLLAAAAAESVDAELWHCDRHFELIAEVTGQPMRRVGT